MLLPEREGDNASLINFVGLTVDDANELASKHKLDISFLSNYRKQNLNNASYIVTNQKYINDKYYLVIGEFF